MQKYLEKEKKNEIMKEREESRTLKELKKMEDAAVGQMQMDIMHGAIVEKKIRRDERLREDITHHKELRKERNQEENASRSYLFQYNTKQTKKKPQQPIQYVEPIPSEPQKENDEGIIGDWCYVDDPYVKVNSEDIDESTN
ncbi:U1 zinc finger protein [Entamoeba marina]